MVEAEQKLPAKFGPFYLYDRIGYGGMAEIFLAKSFTGLGTERHCAIKRILPVLSNDESFGEMLINEAKLCARLSHANVVQTYDLGQIDERYYIAEEYVEGFDLNRLLGLLSRAKTPLPLQFALYIIIETLRGLDYAHRLADESGGSLGIIHRDVSPTNILISTQGEVKVCDFGIAKVQLGNFESDHIDEYHLKGKIAYMSPEYLNGEPIDARADLYASGILLWELLSGRRLFKSKDEAQTMERAKNADVPPLQDRGFPEFERLNRLVVQALDREPAKRFQTGQSFIEALRDYMQEAELIVSQLKFSDFLMDHFGESLLSQRRERERNLKELMNHQNELDAEPLSDADGEEKAEALLATFSEWDEDSGLQDNLLKKIDDGTISDEALRRPISAPQPTPEREAAAPDNTTPPVPEGDWKPRNSPAGLVAGVAIAVIVIAIIAYLLF